MNRIVLSIAAIIAIVAFATWAEAANAPHDGNHVPALLGVSSFDSLTTIPIQANASSSALMTAHPTCTLSTESIVAVGSGASTLILASSTNRAWAIIQQPANATNTLTVSFEQAAVAGRGVLLSPATTTSPVPSVKFGLNTDMAYNGAVYGIEGTSGSTVAVTECTY